jgi:hypothetical protein
MPADWLDGNGGGGAVDVHELAGENGAWKGLLDIVAAGALVSMGTTSDGGALGVTLTIDGRWRRDYFRTADELLTWLAEAVPYAEAESGRDRPSAVAAARPRRSKSR